jgi:EAL domain-containing protein (putative c-di-GMP-specific phosphodiesterase class I)
LDDFGSGMSSYAYLKNLPVDFLKIDGVFVKDIARNTSDYAVAKSVCEIGHFLGKTVIAEFVQDRETVSVLKDIGVDYVQGYGVERPLPLDALLTA